MDIKSIFYNGQCTFCDRDLVQGSQGDEEALELKCTHIFHRACVDLLLREEENCPICLDRVEVINVVSVEENVVSVEEEEEEEEEPYIKGDVTGVFIFDSKEWPNKTVIQISSKRFGINIEYPV